MAHLDSKPTDSLHPDPAQPRKTFDETELDRLGADLAFRGVLVPLLIKPDGTIIDGERRWRAAKRRGIKDLPVITTEKALQDKELRGIQLATVFHREDLSGYERWTACAELMCMNPGWKIQDLTDFLHLDPSMGTRLLSPSRCIPAVQEALKEGKIGISTCYAMSKCATPEEQAKMLAAALNGATRDQLEQAVRKSRNGAAATVKLSRVKIAMPQGASVVVSGADLSMSELVELLAETLKEARKAAEQYDVKTFQSMMRDKARAG